MKIALEGMEKACLPKFKGGKKAVEARMYADDLNRMMLGRLEPGASIGLHAHDAGSEIIYILQGQGRALYDSGMEDLAAGDCHYCPKGHSHSLINDGREDLLFFAVIPQQ